MARLIAIELFKVRKRWMPWILLGIMIAILALFQFGMYAAQSSLERIEESRSIEIGVTGTDGREVVVKINCEDLLAGRMPESLSDADPQLIQQISRDIEQFRQQCQRMTTGQQEASEQIEPMLTFPRAVEGIFSMAQSVGGFLMVILAASIIGAEYAWGTVRTNIIRGVERCRYLSSKLMTVLLLTLAGLAVTFAFGFVFAIGTTLLSTGGIDWGFLGGLFVPRVLAMFGRTWFVLTIPISMAVMVAVLTRSSAVAIGVGIAYPIIEAIVANVLAGIAGWGETFQQYTIGYNISSVMALNSMGETYASAGVNLGNAPGDATPAFWRTASVLVGYGLAFLVVAFYSFRKRDLTA